MKIMTKSPHQVKQLYQSIQFSEQLINPDLWIAKANELLNAADILKPEVITYWSEVCIENQRVSVPNTKNVQGAYFLLIAYALENYFKALLIYRNRKLLKNRLLPDINHLSRLSQDLKLKQHNLVRLAQAIQFKLSVPEEELLSRLSQNSEWKARYPVPTDSNGLVAVKKFSNGQVGLIAYFGPKDITRIDNFIGRLCKHVTKEVKQRENQ